MQCACKPGSVVGSHLSGTDIAARLKPPVRRLAEQAVAPESVLLRIEFTGWNCYQPHRWALTPPFHPYPKKWGGLFLLHLSGGRPRPMLSVILLCEARTFLTGSPLRGCPAHCRYILSAEAENVKKAFAAHFWPLQVLHSSAAPAKRRPSGLSFLLHNRSVWDIMER